MDNNYENIVPWNGANDTGRDVRLKLQRNFAKIVVNFQELDGKFTTVDDLFDLIAQELDKKLSKVDSDTAAGLITFLKGLVSEGLIKAQEGIELGDFLSGILGSGGCFKVNPQNGKTYIEADEIYIRLKAVFDTLEIRHSTHVGGQQILSPAGMTCIRVEEYDTYYRCFMKADDGSKAVQNLFAENDQAQCRDINVKEGIYDNVSNQYYWRLVVGVGDDYIDLSKDDCDTGSTVPAAGEQYLPTWEPSI